MNNKILISVYVPSLMEKYEVIIPVNERISKIITLLKKMIYDLSDSNFNINEKYYLIDPLTSNVYDKNLIVRDTNINNAKELILIN